MRKRYLVFGLFVGLMAFASSCSKYGIEFPDGYQSGDSTETALVTDTTMGKADRSLYHKARIYPGLVGENVTRIKDTTISMLMNRKYVSSYEFKVSVTPAPIYTTGLYAPAGEVIRITVPTGAVGMTVQIGVHTDNITGKDAPRRDPILFTRKELFPGTNYIKNLYGGTIWIINQKASATPVNIKVAGAVKTTDFILGKSTVADWKKQVLSQDVPWMDLIGERVAFSVPRSLVVKFIQSGKMDQVDEALRLWDDTYVKDYYNWMGLSADAADPKNRYPEFWERGVMDIHPSLGYAHSGSPWIMQEDEYWLDELTNPNTIKKGTSWGSYHEVGHNYQATWAWSWSDLGETTNNLFIFNAARNRGVTSRIDFAHALKTSIPAALKFAALTSAKNFSNFPEELGIDADDPFARLTPFLQIFDKTKGKNGESGWDFFPYIYSKARNENFTSSLDQGKRDYFYRQLCNFTGKDFNRFFIAWGIPVSSSAKREMREKYPPMDRAIWEYNPLTFTGGEGVLQPRYFLPSGLFEFTANVATATNESTGKFSAMTDGDPNTYWHTCWSGCSIPTTLPVELTMNMKEVNVFKGFYYKNRANSTFATKVNVFISKDNKNWTDMGQYALASASQTTAQNAAMKEFTFSNLVEAQYVKFVFPDPNTGGDIHVAIAELGVFYDI
ncbi:MULTISPECIES: M60 family metallopeptidase [Sphingobacterium]|uniref:M60 family metallopeptidase n=1 Tax=Sphingobacterium TaxID=28453 RepID=UPI00257B9B4D|nr:MULTISPECIES: M60 family metallopeptidase [Sphingobacterium]